MVSGDTADVANSVCVSNPGYSGTPLWKIQAQVKEAQERMKATNPTQNNYINEVVKFEEEKAPPLYAHGVTLGGAALGGGKPVTRHLLIKDLRKVAKSLRVTLPSQGLFEAGAPLGLFALFDGQSCAGQVGPNAAEFCARTFHSKLLRNLAALPPDKVNETFVKACLVKSFDDLDGEVKAKGDIFDGCGCACALTVGQRVFTAVLGTCDAVLTEVTKKAPKGKIGNPTKVFSVGKNQGKCDLPEEDAAAKEQAYVEKFGGRIVEMEGQKYIANPDGTATSPVTRSLGDVYWKDPLPGQQKPLLRNAPQITCHDLSWGDRHPFILLVSSPVASKIQAQDLMEMAAGFPLRPKAASGAIATKAFELTEGKEACCVCTISLVPPGWEEVGQKGTGAGPAAKKQKTDETKSVRIRHILVRHKETNNPHDPVRNRPVTRTAEEAEVLLRDALKNLREANEDIGDPLKPEKVSPKFQEVCRAISECPTSQKGGGMCGDLGWLTKDQLKQFGEVFEETVRNLRLACWSDIISSPHGLHIVLRMF